VARTGDEPMHARSALGLRLGLTLAGLVCWAGAAVVMLVVGERVIAAVFGAVAVLAGVNAAVVVHRIRQGPHWQPGRTTPPYRPLPENRARPTRLVRPPVDERTRARRYLLIMGVCLGLIVLAWGVVRLWSVPAAVVMSMIAMVLPPIAALVANSGWDRDGG
jgi:Family of unknown function (DUF6343)/Protein of unknown function (DUF3099)